MKFTVRVTNGVSEWDEEYDKDVDDAQKWAEDTCAWFNSTLRPGERERSVVSVTVSSYENDNHRWEKRTDGQSVLFRGRICDLMYCAKCGVTGKRFGLSSTVVIDSKFSKKKFRKCTGKAV